MTFQKSLFSCKMACFRDGFSVPHHGCVLTGHFPVAWTYSLQWVNFSRDCLCIAPLLRDTSQTQPSYRRAQITCYKTGPVQWNPKGEWDSLVLGWTGWQKVLGQAVSINCQTAAGNSCCHASSHTRQELPWDPWAGTLAFAGVTAEGCSLCSLTSSYSSAISVLHAWRDSLTTWLTPDLSLKVSVTGIQKIWEAQPGTTEGSAHCLVHVGVSTAQGGRTAGFSWVTLSRLMPSPKHRSFKCNHNWHAHGCGLTAIFLDLVS